MKGIWKPSNKEAISRHSIMAPGSVRPRYLKVRSADSKPRLGAVIEKAIYPRGTTSGEVEHQFSTN